MNTSNIDALAAAAEARVGEGIIMSLREGLDDSRAATAIHSLTALPPLPPLDGVGAAETVPLANQFSHGGLRGDLEDVLQNGQGDIIGRVDMPQVAAQPHQQQQQQQPTQKATASKSTTRRKPTFAEKLHLILSNRQLSSLITWLPSGKSFCILDKDRFAHRILPVYFREVKFGEQLRS